MTILKTVRGSVLWVILFSSPCFAAGPAKEEVEAAIQKKDFGSLVRWSVEQSSKKARNALGLHVIENDEWATKEKVQDSLIKYLDHKDIRLVDNAVRILGDLKLNTAVPALIRVMESDRDLVKPASSGNAETASQGEINARETIIDALVNIGDKRAVPTLEKFLSPEMSKPVYAGNAASALYQMTGKRYQYLEYNGIYIEYKPPRQ